MAIPSRPEDLGVPRDSTDIGRGDQVFVRRATGLVREGSMLDAAIFNLMWWGSRLR